MKSCLNDDDGDADDGAEDSQNASNSSAKSVDAASRNTVQSSHPYRVIEKDGLSIHSLQSLGRVGRILSGSLDPGALSISKESSQQSPQLETPTNSSPTTSVGENRETQKSQQQKSDDSHSQCSNYSLVTSASAGNQINTVLQEPDVIASTKLSQSKTTDSVSELRYA